ncbi:MAG: dihydrolipoamide acetyltransferase family protein [Planctomycetota bacterium]|nr:dihydrolipoamide acetyltransferase family protein [Planctomycetota bacterium]
MARDIRLPQLGETMKEGTIVNCLVKVGDEVKKGQVIFEIETDKATLDMESPADGFVKHILVEVNQTLLVGVPILVLGDKDEDVPQSFIDSLKGAASAGPATAVAAPPAAEPAKAEPEVSKPAGRVMASPRAKKLAEEFGVDLTKVTGTGPGGKITEEDVKGAAPALASQEAAGEVKLGDTIPLNRLQKITAERMLKSKREIPCFYLTVRADVTELVKLRTKLNETSDVRPVRNSIGNNMRQKGKISNGVKLSYNDFIIKAVAIGLEKFPIMTGQLAGDAVKLAEAIHVGIAISVPDGLVAPVVKDVNRKDVKQIARDSQALIERARSNRLSPTDLEGGCITVSNLGSFGIDSFIAIVVPGQCSILGIGRITDTCVPDEGTILVRKLMNMTLSADHKVTNGAYAAQFLDFVRKLLEDTATFGLGY